MWIDMQCEIGLKMEGDSWETIINTAREKNMSVSIVIIAGENYPWAGDSSLCQFK